MFEKAELEIIKIKLNDIITESNSDGWIGEEELEGDE